MLVAAWLQISFSFRLGRGLLEEEWGLTETNREAKFYRLTPAGRKQLASETARWRDYSAIMTAALAATR